jgi:hypothetical protein
VGAIFMVGCEQNHNYCLVCRKLLGKTRHAIRKENEASKAHTGCIGTESVSSLCKVNFRGSGIWLATSPPIGKSNHSSQFRSRQGESQIKLDHVTTPRACAALN